MLSGGAPRESAAWQGEGDNTASLLPSRVSKVLKRGLCRVRCRFSGVVASTLRDGVQHAVLLEPHVLASSTQLAYYNIMAVATEINALSDDEIVERLRVRTEEFNKLKEQRAAAKTADPATGLPKKPWYMPVCLARRSLLRSLASLVLVQHLFD